MMGTRRLIVAAVAVLCLAPLVGSVPQAVAAPRSPAAAAPPGAVLAGASSRSLLPRVGGSVSYIQHGLPGLQDPVSLGVFVKAFDDGRVAVGNGDTDAHWVHDDIRAHALALQRPGDPHVVVLLSTDLYMIFKADGDAIRAEAERRLPAARRGHVEMFIAATHNHHGPDTAFDVNHPWYDSMIDRAAAAIADAVKRMRPARLRVGQGRHWFSQDDGTDPQILDPRMNVLQATGTDGKVIGTVVQWNNHPETTLNWKPPVDISRECAVLGWTGDNCTAEGRYFTADYPGVVARTIARRVGGETVYFNGALGHIIGPGGANVWEVDAQHPLGNQFDPPPGAKAPGGGSFTYTDDNFRRAVVIGEQVAIAALKIVNSGKWVTDTTLRSRHQAFYSRLSNIGFRVLLVVDPATGYTKLGHVPPVAYTCPATGPKNDKTCRSEGFATEEDPIAGTIRTGDHLKTEASYLHIGSEIGMMFLPGEVAGELVVGLPSRFRSNPGLWYDEPRDEHPFGAALTTPGYVLGRMHDRYRFTIGLGNDELGYIFPIANWRIACVADEVAGPGKCAQLHADGWLDYPDSIAGQTCKEIYEDPHRLDGYPTNVAFFLNASCRYGQALGEAQGHYEETNSAGWDLAADLLQAVSQLTGDSNPAMVNPSFAGYWSGYPPPADIDPT
jgi:hypothetical protein